MGNNLNLMSDYERNEAWLEKQGFNNLGKFFTKGNVFCVRFFIDETPHDEFVEAISKDLIDNGFEVIE